MISPEEMDYLYWLGRDVWDGSTGVFELGPWLGGSTWCLASGLRDNPRRRNSRPLHVIDNFVWRPFMKSRSDVSLTVNGSFRPVFESNLAPLMHLVNVHEASLPDDSSADLIHDQPVRTGSASLQPVSGNHFPPEIGIAFIDGAKSWKGFLYLWRELSPRCHSGALISFQDFKSWQCYWVALGVAAVLRQQPGSLEVAHVLEHNTVTLRVTERLGSDMFRDFPDDIASFSTEEGVSLIDQGADLLAGEGDMAGAAVVRLAAVSFLGTMGRWDEALMRFRMVEQQWPWSSPSVAQLRHARRWLEGRTGKRIHRLPRWWLLMAYSAALSRWRRLHRALSRARRAR